MCNRVPEVSRYFSRNARGITTCPFEETVVVAIKTPYHWW
jgi:hypothetical protein